MMLYIDYPQQEFKIKETETGKSIFDAIRKKWVQLTPEEWVRQNFIQYLIMVKKYPQSLIAVEKEIMLGALKKRFDILIYDKNHRPWMMIECKAPEIVLNDAVLEQLLRYNIAMPVSFLIITNGDATMGWEKKDQQLKPLQELPVLY